MTHDEARQEAVRYLRPKVEGYGVTHRDLCNIIHEGYGAPGEPGYEIGYGRITVPGAAGPKPRHTFSTDELVEAIRNGQCDLFGGAA